MHSNQLPLFKASVFCIDTTGESREETRHTELVNFVVQQKHTQAHTEIVCLVVVLNCIIWWEFLSTLCGSVVLISSRGHGKRVGVAVGWVIVFCRERRICFQQNERRRLEKKRQELNHLAKYSNQTILFMFQQTTRMPQLWCVFGEINYN